MTARQPRVAILGGGMGGMAAAWRLSEPGWRDEFESITVYQRGWRLGGKGASSRGRNGRIEEHGLHIWFGNYENAFRLLRDCYEELDRAATDPGAPIRTWRDAMIPARALGLEDRRGDGWAHWIGEFSTNHRTPGSPQATGREATAVEILRRAFTLVADFVASLPAPGEGSGRSDALASGVVALASALAFESIRGRGVVAGSDPGGRPAGGLDGALAAMQASLGDAVRADPDARRSWHLVSLMTAVIRGILSDGLLTDPQSLRAINDEDFVDWIVRHGATPDVADFTFVRGMYNLVFGYENGHPDRWGFGAGMAVFLTGKMLFDYKGSIFWKMAAGMGDVVFAPLYQVLSARGVRFEFFHRVDQLHLSSDRSAIDAISVGRQVRLAAGCDRYEPLVRVNGLPCFPSVPIVSQLTGADGIEGHALESHFCAWPDAERRVLRRGEDFDLVVFAIPPGMAEVVCAELVDDRREWKEMVTRLGTVATQALQLWLREPELELGWQATGAVVSGYVEPFTTWASMPQLIEAEAWPEHDRPGSIAYFCGVLDDEPARFDGRRSAPEFAAHQRARVRASAVRFMQEDLRQLLPGAVGDGGFRWELLCGAGDRRGESRLDSQFWLANVDPSDRYVQSLPGSDRYRLRADESGYDNLILAGDWIDTGLNAGCIEAAVVSGLQAANAVRGRSRDHRVMGYFLP